MIKHLFSSLIFSLCIVFNVQAQPGSIDQTFNIGTGFTQPVYSVQLQPDGKILAAGYFVFFNGTQAHRIARLNSDGSIDTGFNTNPAFSGTVGSGTTTAIQDIALQPDGKVIAIGQFSSYKGNSYPQIVRINSDASVDTTFDPKAGFTDQIGKATLLLQPDGKVIATGAFTHYDSTYVYHICRINTNGSLDTTLTPGTGPQGGVNAMVLLDSGQFMVVGYFTYYNGISPGVDNVVRVNADGSLDQTFNTGIGFSSNHALNNLVEQPDGKMICVGSYNTFQGLGVRCIVRLNPDGSYDPTFNVGTGFYGEAESAILQPDGKCIIAGDFTEYNGTSVNRIIRLNPDGSIDPTFDVGTGFNGKVDQLTMQPDGKIIASGYFTEYNGTSQRYITRLNNDITTAADETVQIPVSVYPNPTAGYLNIIGLSEPTDITITDITGRMVLKAYSQSQVDLSNLRSGIYAITFRSESSSKTFKIVKQ